MVWIFFQDVSLSIQQSEIDCWLILVSCRCCNHLWGVYRNCTCILQWLSSDRYHQINDGWFMLLVGCVRGDYSQPVLGNLRNPVLSHQVLVAGVYLFINRIGSSATMKGLEVRPRLVNNDAVIQHLHKFFNTDSGMNRSLDRNFDWNAGTTPIHPVELNVPFAQRARAIRRAPHTFASPN